MRGIPCMAASSCSDSLKSSSLPAFRSWIPLACPQRVRLRCVFNAKRLRIGQLSFLECDHGSSRRGIQGKRTTRVSCQGGDGNNKPAVLQPSNASNEFLIGGDGDVTETTNVVKITSVEVEVNVSNVDVSATSIVGNEGTKDSQISQLKEVLKVCQEDLEKARVNSTHVESEAQRFAERAIALRDQAAAAESAVISARTLLEDQKIQEVSGKEALLKAEVVLGEVRARVKKPDSQPEPELQAEDELDDGIQAEMQKCEDDIRSCEVELSKIQSSKMELEKEAARLSELADVAKAVAVAADEDVATAMMLAEKAVALEVEAAQRLSDAEIALQKVENQPKDATVTVEVSETVITPVLKPEPEVKLEEPVSDPVSKIDVTVDEVVAEVIEALIPEISGTEVQQQPEIVTSDVSPEKELKEILDKVKPELEVLASGFARKTEVKDTVSASDSAAPKLFTKKSSRFFPASFFSFDEAEEFSPSVVFSGLVSTAKSNMPKVIAAGLLLLGGGLYLGGRVDKIAQLGKTFEISLNVEDAAVTAKPLVRKLYKMRSQVTAIIDKLSHQEVNEEEASLLDVLWLLLASVVFVPLFQKIPGGSPVLGYLAAGVLIGPHSLHIIQNVHGTKAIAELGVVFLLFNIGLELSVERLSSMRKYVFGFGSSQVLASALATGLVVHYIARVAGPAAIVIGNGLALSSTAVVLQVLQERGESTSRHGRATFSVLLFQDLAVVVLLILIPLLSPNSSKGGVGFEAIAQALGIAAIKGVIAISGIIAGGRLLLRPIYKSMAEIHNAEIFAANTLLVVLGTSLLTARAGLSMALGAFLAGLLLSETEFALQVESDIAPYRGLLLGLFFMTVGMSIDPRLLVAKFPVIMGSLALLIVGKTLVITVLGKQFGLSDVAAVRAGLLLAPGGEFAFVAFGDAVNQGIMSPQLSSLLFLVVGLSMAITPWLAAAGQLIASKFEQQDVRSLLPAENETDDLEGHMIVCGFGRVGQIISQMLSERLIPFVALDVRSERVSMGRSLDLPVYFGDAGSREVLHKLGAERAAAAVITLDTPGANYRAVWALSKYFPNVKTYVRAHDVDHGINLEKAGATAVVPETLEPSLQLAAAVLAEAKLPASEIASTINEFRTRHLAELTELTKASGTSLGYGFSQTAAAPKPKDDGGNERRLGGVVAVP